MGNLYTIFIISAKGESEGLDTFLLSWIQNEAALMQNYNLHNRDQVSDDAAGT